MEAFLLEIATSFAGSASDPAATLWKVSVATRCLFHQSLPTAIYESLNRERSQLLGIIQNMSGSAWYLLQTVRRCDERHYLEKIDAVKLENCRVYKLFKLQINIKIKSFEKTFQWQNILFLNFLNEYIVRNVTPSFLYISEARGYEWN